MTERCRMPFRKPDNSLRSPPGLSRHLPAQRSRRILDDSRLGLRVTVTGLRGHVGIAT